MPSGRPLATAVAALVVMALLCPDLTGVAETQAQSETAWRLDVNRQVFKARSWNWILRFVERKGDRLVLGIVYKNNASSPRSLFLAEGFQTSTLLTDQATSKAYPLLTVSGISDEGTKVGRRKRKTALFTFPYPTGATQVTFSSVWTVALMNAATRVQVEFPVPIPHDESLLPVKDSQRGHFVSHHAIPATTLDCKADAHHSAHSFACASASSSMLSKTKS